MKNIEKTRVTFGGTIYFQTNPQYLRLCKGAWKAWWDPRDDVVTTGRVLCLGPPAAGRRSPWESWLEHPPFTNDFPSILMTTHALYSRLHIAAFDCRSVCLSVLLIASPINAG